jgi:tetratricopeptide (TPR) repeat protein
VLITLAAYAPAIRCGYIWDDDYYVTRNFNLRSTQGLIDLWTRPGVVPQYYPFTHTTFWLEYHLWGLRPAGYHAVNVTLHAISAVLLWLILRRLNVPGAWFAAAIFALHPVHVESVAWITERKNVLSGVLSLAALYVYLPLTVFAQDDAAPRRFPWLRYFTALALFTLALLSKSVTASLPAAILLIIWWKRGRIEMRDFLPLLPMFALGLLMSYQTATMEREVVGAWGPEWNYTGADRILIAGRAVWFYAWKLIWPAKLTFIYPRWPIEPEQLWQWLFPLAAVGVVGVTALMAARGRVGRGPLAALLFFGGTLVPALGFVNVLPMRYSFVADHFQYLASIGLIALIVAAGARWLGRAGAPVAAGVMIVLAVLTVRRQAAFRDLRALWADTIEKNPNSWMVRNNYAKLLLLENDLPAAETQLRAAIKLDENNADVLTNLGVLKEAEGKPDEAIEMYTAATQAGHDDALAHYHLGRLLATRPGQLDAALFHLNRVIEAKPQLAPAHEELARILSQLGRPKQAIAQLEQAVRADPDLLSAQNNLAMALLSEGRVDEAERRLRDIVGRFPDSATARNNLGIALERRGDLAGAISCYERAHQLSPNDVQIRQNLERARAKSKT